MALGITTQGLRKEYPCAPPLGPRLRTPKNGTPETPRSVAALDGLTLDVQAGDIFGLLGPNGAGKTTTLRVLTTLVRPTSGRASVLGFDVVDQPLEIRRFRDVLVES